MSWLIPVIEDGKRPNTLARFSAAGIAAGTNLAAGSKGTDDTPVQAQFGDTFTVIDDATMGKAVRITATQLSHLAFLMPNAAQREVGLRFYFRRPTAWSGAAWPLITGWSSVAPNHKWRYIIGGDGQPGQFRLANESGTQDLSAQGLYGLNEWMRAEMYVKADPNADGTTTDGQVRALGYRLHETTPLWDSGWLTRAVGAGMTHIRWGLPIALPATPGTTDLAHLLVTDDADTLIGPLEGTTPAPPGYTLLLHNGGGATTAATVLGVHNGDGTVTPAPALIAT